MFISRCLYYLSSLTTLAFGVKNWHRIMIRLIARRLPFIVELSEGHRFWARSLMDIWIIKETCLDRDYERHGTRIEDDWIVIDIGAGLGDFAVSVAREHPTSLVYAYEPFLDSFDLLQGNIALNQASNVRSFPYAIGANSGVMHLDTTTGIAVQHSTAKALASLEARSPIQVASRSLDAVFEEEQLSHCDFLKVDCEGGEYDIFFRASDVTLSKITHICLEYHDGVTQYAHDDLMVFFERKGFSVQVHPNPVHHHLGFLYASRSSSRRAIK
ncbi:MAG TPA: FkbM family methyltransferase [Chloroflexi bacterium]|nr:FkbM family methyltransferase [Chloroflexota bacterium]